MTSSRRSLHNVGKIWGLKNNKSQQNAPRTILGLFPTATSQGGDKCQRKKKS